MMKIFLALFAIALLCIVGNTQRVADWLSTNNRENKEKLVDSGKSLEKPKPFDFSTIPSTNPALNAANNSRLLMAAREEDLLVRLTSIRSLITDAKNNSAKKDITITEFLKLAKEVRQSVKLASEGLIGLSETTDLLCREIKYAPQAYIMAAESIRSRASDYTTLTLKKNVLEFADEFDRIAAILPERAEALQKFQGEIPKMRSRIREAEIFLDDMNLFLEAHPGGGVSDPRKKYTGEFEFFINSFSELIRSLESFREVLKSQASSQKIQEEYRAELGDRLKAIAKATKDLEPSIENGLTWLEARLLPPKAELARNAPIAEPEPPSPPQMEAPVTSQSPIVLSTQRTPSTRVVYTRLVTQRKPFCCFRLLRIFRCLR